MRRLKKMLITTLVLLIVAGGAVGGYLFMQYKGIWGNPQELLTSLLDEFDLSKTVTYNGEKYVYNKDIVTLMLMGLDESEGRNSARSDMMVVVAIDTANNTAKMIVCPRDTRTSIRKTDKNGNETGDEIGKLNWSFPYGGGNEDKNAGGENVMYNVSRLLSCDGKYTIPISKYGGITMEGIGPLTDAAGGVTIELPEGMQGVGSKGETVTLNAQTAELYCVQRKGTGLDGSDISRGQRQMSYLLALMQEIKEMSATSIISLYNKVDNYAFTNMATDEMVAYASYLKSIPGESMQITQLQGTSVRDGQWYYDLDADQLEALVIETFYKKK